MTSTDGSTMSRPRGTYSEQHLELVHRQMQLWITNVDDGATDDWLPEGELTAPRGVRVPTARLPSVIDGWHVLFKDLRIDLTTLVVSDDGDWMTIEWVWHVTRRSDGASKRLIDALATYLGV